MTIEEAAKLAGTNKNDIIASYSCPAAKKIHIKESFLE